MRGCLIPLILVICIETHAASFVTIGGGPSEMHTTYAMTVHGGAFSKNDITLNGYRWQLTFGGSSEKWEMYGQFRMFDSRWESSSLVAQNEQGYQTVSIKRWQWDRALAGGFRYNVSQSHRVTILFGGGVLLGTGHGHQQEQQTTTIVHEDHSRDVTVDYIYEYKLGGLKAGIFTDFVSRIKLTNYLFLEALLESSLSSFGGMFFPASSSSDKFKNLDEAQEVSFNVNLRWDMGRAIPN